MQLPRQISGEVRIISPFCGSEQPTLVLPSPISVSMTSVSSSFGRETSQRNIGYVRFPSLEILYLNFVSP